ncbi:MAG TPA: SLC13 family permease [Candidatus Dormibacteraeota bacterium]|nr:SLC13 family permease [Candidatus Dormibacteraeota bacterium]
MTASEEHPAEIAAQEELLRSIDYLRDLNRVDIARLIGSSEDAHFDVGTVIVREGEVADSLYLLAEGTVEVSVLSDGADRSVASITAPATFGDFGVLLAERTATVRAVTDVHVWRIPRLHFERLLRERPELGLAIARGLAGAIDRRDRMRVGAPLKQPASSQTMMAGPRSRRSGRSRIIGAAISIGVPAALWLLPAPQGLSNAGWHIALVMVGGAIAWLLEPVPDFAVALGMAAAWMATGLAPPALAFAGFASSAWVTAVAALGISAAMAASGLLFRAALMLLRVFPPTHRGQVAALLVGGVVLTPLAPTVFGRVATVAPVARDLSQALGHARKTGGSASIAFAGILGSTILGPVFLTGLVTNFLIMGLLPAAEQARFGWMGWLVAAAPAGLLLLIGSAVTLFVLDPRSGMRASSVVRRTQERSLGRVSRRELASLVAIGVFIVGLLLQPVLRLDIAVIGLASLLVAIAGGAMDRQIFRSGIDWATLVLFGVLLGAGGVLRSGGVDRWIADLITPVARSLGHPALVIPLLTLLVIVVRLVLPMVPAGFLLLVTLVPAAPQLGLSGWVVGFVVSVAVLTWVLPRQYEVLRMVREMTDDEMFSDRQALAVGVSITVIATLTLLICVPYWQAIGIL